MSNYTSDNTIILATHEQGDNTRMLLLHKCDSRRLEYVIGSYFTVTAPLPDGEVNSDGSVSGNADGFADKLAFELFWHKAVKHYSWDWGHYFGEFIDAARYWERVLADEQ